MAKNAKSKKNNEQTLGQEISKITSNVSPNTKYIVGWVIGLLALFIILNYAFPIIYKALGVGTINYGGLVFTKENIAQAGAAPLIVYHYYYLYKDSTGQVVQNNIYLRNNPETNTVPVTSKIEFFHGVPIYIGVDADNLAKCNQSSLAISQLASFLTNAGFKARGGTINKTAAVQQNLTYVSCDAQNSSTVINFVMGNDTEISRNSQICYKMSVASCSDVLSASEKFIARSIIDAKNRSSSSSDYVFSVEPNQ